MVVFGENLAATVGLALAAVPFLGLPAFYELHVWAWRDNPKGVFADWNTRVSCEGR